ncbi:MAG: hypothetical protein HKO66_09105 [Saprospiraceae bacterium]|nr:hypothetical protein [Bacteroidia bacterium]NNE16151.1 hypothetical protein [Saprospiraceae bacterium]NNL92375.1 hypothetical protein [Saprospiraceae bacterium]
MLKNILKLNAFALLLLTFFVSSCTKEDADVVADNYGSVETYEMQKSLNAGKKGCLEVVFPVEITLPDDSVIEVSSFVDAKDQIQAWKEANPDVDGRPSVIYPIEVITMDGETVSIESKSEIKDLLKECRSNFDGPRGHKACFKLVYPISVEFPNETVAEFQTPRAMKNALRVWKRLNRDSDERPHLVYPLTIEFEDGSTQVINSGEELKAAKQACRD